MIEDRHIFSFPKPSKIVENTLRHRCPFCGCGSVEVLAIWKFEEHEPGSVFETAAEPTTRESGIFRCLGDQDHMFVPSMPWL